MIKIGAYWRSGADLTMPFFIRRMDTVGRKDAPPIPLTALPMFGFMFLSSGQVLLDMDGVPLLLGSGQMLLIPPGKAFAVKYYQDSTGFTGGFRESFLKDPSHPILRCGTFSVNSFDGDTTLLLSGVFSRILAAYPGDTPYIVSAVDFVLSHLRLDDKALGNSVATRFIDMVFDRGRTIGDVASYAQLLGVSPDMLGKMVRRHSNHTCVEWIGLARMSLSRQLLRETDLPISEVSYAVGIEDPSYFTRFFRKMEGVTPSRFRKRESKKS